MNKNSYTCCQTNSVAFKKINSITRLLSLLSEPNRLQLLCLLSSQSHCVCEMMQHFSLSQSLTSHHLQDLKQAGLIKAKKDTNKVYYSLTYKGNRIYQHIMSLPLNGKEKRL